MDDNYRLGAIAYIFDNQKRILIDNLVTYSDNEWNFPGGGRGDSETALENIYREIKEELSIDNEDLELIGRPEKPYQYDFPEPLIREDRLYKGQLKEQFIFKFKGNKSSLKADPKEIRAYKWVDVTDLIKYLIFPNQYNKTMEAIKDYL